MTAQPSASATLRLIEAQRRIIATRRRLQSLSSLDPGFAAAINAYRAALDALAQQQESK